MELSRGEQQVAVKSLISSLNSISALDDRSAALVTFPHLEGALQQAVANKLICCDDTEIYNRLFQDGPLSSFYSQMGISKNASWIVIDGESGNSLACR